MPGKKRGVKKGAARKRGAVKAATRKGGSRVPDSEARPPNSIKPVQLQFPIVGIGASAGGLEALDQLFESMPSETGMAFVVVTHQHPGHTSLLPELLGRETKMAVAEAGDGVKLEPNHVYIGPPGGHLAILNGRLHRMDVDVKESPKLPIDHFFRSLAEDQKERAIGIVLSGTGTDGTLGVKAIKGNSGMVMVQQPQSAAYAGMPSSAIATGLADYVLPPIDMPEQLVAYTKGPFLLGGAAAAASPPVPAEPMEKIFVLLRSRTGHDFSAYKSNTIRRRLERRMNVHQIPNPDQYVRYLQENPHEIDLLFKELLISVTNFFRDPEAWEAFAPHLEELIASRGEHDPIRAWVPGTATGEEAFSLAIALREAMDKGKRYHEVQVFGTDLDGAAIETARAGRFPEGIAGDVSPELLQRCFVREENTYCIRREIREMAVFAPQNVIKDPPFTKVDILSCRNLLIYLNADLQKKLVPIFHYALKPGGLLFLGPSETIGSFADLFEPLDKRWKIFRRRGGVTASREMPQMPAQPILREEGRAAPVVAPLAGREPRLPALVERFLLGRFAPACVVANERGEILFVHGRTGAYLELPPGEPRHNVLEMAREGLQIEISSAMRACLSKGEEVTREDIRIKANGEFLHVDLSVSKFDEPEAIRGLLLLSFRPTPVGAPGPATPKRRRKAAGDGKRTEQLERELQSLTESHQSTLEELETSNEELQSTNEELQSSNEELETSKEEMQSLNEELTTVNAELQAKVDALSQTNDDMQNLLNSTDIATVFLDGDLNIKRFTEQARELVLLRESDVGRPISELASNLKTEKLVESCDRVLRTLVFKEEEVETEDGSSYLMRITPYRTGDNVIDGLVLTFVNISKLRQAERAGARAQAYFESVVDAVREPLVVLDAELRVLSANRSFYRVFQTTARQTEGELIYELNSGRWGIPELRKLLEEILPENTKFDHYEVELDLPGDGRRVFFLNARRIEQHEGAGNLILLALDETAGG